MKIEYCKNKCYRLLQNYFCKTVVVYQIVKLTCIISVASNMSYIYS